MLRKRFGTKQNEWGYFNFPTYLMGISRATTFLRSLARNENRMTIWLLLEWSWGNPSESHHISWLMNQNHSPRCDKTCGYTPEQQNLQLGKMRCSLQHASMTGNLGVTFAHHLSTVFDGGKRCSELFRNYLEGFWWCGSRGTGIVAHSGGTLALPGWGRCWTWTATWWR